MIALNVNTLGDFPEDLIMAKMDIEAKLLEDGIIKEKQPFQDFIMTLALQDCVYMKGRDVIPFRFIEGKKDKYLIYVNDDTNHGDLFEDLVGRLRGVNFDVTKFVKQDIDMMLKHDLDKDQLFIINGHYYQ
jgi:hypothetical protein